MPGPRWEDVSLSVRPLMTPGHHPRPGERECGQWPASPGHRLSLDTSEPSEESGLKPVSEIDSDTRADMGE